VRSLLFLLAFSGCASRVQRAETSAPKAVAAPIASATPYVVDSARSTLMVYAVDVFGNDHKMSFGAWEAKLDVGKTAHLVARIDMTTVEVETAGATNIVRRHILEVDRFPTATLDATLERTSGDEHSVIGLADLHGVKRSLRFTGTLRAEGDGYRLKSEFVLSRKAFKIRYGPVEPFLRDDVRVVLDVLAVPAVSAAEENR
jgi:polyisoprenoid-binding protein YceI